MKDEDIQSLVAFLEHEDVKYPKVRPANISFQEYVNRIFKDYVTKVKSYADSLNTILGLEVESKLAFINSQMICIENALDKYLNGQPASAYGYLAKWMDDEDNFNEYKILQPNFAQYEDKVMHLYRIRKENENTKEISEPKHLFHVPFEDRHKIKRYRFSIPGYPCLYAGSSIYACYQELDCESLSNVYSILLKPTEQNIKILDFGITPKRIAYCIKTMLRDGKINILQTEPNRRDIRARILMWPMQVVSMLKVLYKEAPFVPEYIIPQLILQYIQDNNFNNNKNIFGIRYYSTKCIITSDNTRLGCNYVFPVKKTKDAGYCDHLKDLYHVSDYILWDPEKKRWGTPRESDSCEEIEFNDNGEIKKMQYVQTQMIILEEHLRHLANNARRVS